MTRSGRVALWALLSNVLACSGEPAARSSTAQVAMADSARSAPAQAEAAEPAVGPTGISGGSAAPPPSRSPTGGSTAAVSGPTSSAGAAGRATAVSGPASSAGASGPAAAVGSNAGQAALPAGGAGTAGLGQATPAAPAGFGWNCPAEAPAEQKVPVGEVTLNVACQGSGPIALLLHGWPEYHGTWSKLTPPLVKLGYRVIAPDQRGYNTSDKPASVDDYGIDHLVSDILGLLDQIGKTERVLLVGHDWGGLIAWVVAHRYPERLRALVILAGPHPDSWNRPEVDPVQSMAANGYVPLITAQGGESIIDVADLEIGRHVTSAELDQYHKAWDQPGAKIAMNNWYRANAYPDNRLPTGITVDTKTLLFWGDQDNYCTPSQLKYIPKYVKDLTIQEYSDVDHWIQLQKTDDLIKRIDAFDVR